MNMTAKKDISARYLSEYFKTSKEREGEILDHNCDIVQIHRKTAIRKFRRLQMKDNSFPDKPGRSVYYTSDPVSALKTVWETGSDVCGELIHPIIPEYVKILRKDNLWEHNEAATKKTFRNE